ncbi:sensor histidine kinase [Polymorphobacter fuscus]|nr:ATP-binding protein [Polymorphobacter fuscus]NJC07066.1 signal transduction histidine kinase [Polymorphobacter fuscus]
MVPARWRTTTARITLIVFAALIATSALLLGFIGRVTQDQLYADVRAAVAADAALLVENIRRDGPRRAARDITEDLRLPGPTAVLLLAPDGHRLAGNVTEWPAGLPVGRRFASAELHRADHGRAESFGVSTPTLDGGYRLLVGRSLETEQRLTDTLKSSLFAAIFLALVLAALTSLILARIISARVQNIADVAAAVAAGDLSRRVDEPPAPGGDAFDSMARALNAMLARIEILLGEIRMVTDGLAHDLRSPLTRMKARIDRLARTADAGEPADDILAIGAEADALLTMLENALEISRVEAGIGREAFVPFDVAALARDLADMYEPLAEETGVCLTAAADLPLPVMAHRNLLSRALANLIDNALRYGAGGGIITVTAERTAAGARLSVADRGPGIASANHGIALRRFGRIDAARRAGGAGLGLSLAAAIARLHGGTLTLADNAPGLRVDIDLPHISEAG